ncbi:hypothetical protein BABINDRAFT_159003 [Babjeviella inositovora NRRL Y-12698]|uniref:Uncharacterized protein n=1 Tax=Babjeviella inositovora NRRL Y-12698 TaxID=984486 RepID=A0A1E3QXK0_9ASCO|nr:uncharacterized protein BABINDRAFT_159003 [Babjeviella inositovora NRRL Y-12698]ODQ82400.1 hypothetical protein BABINDRAFT_159003 [Babjeviella inositovora NRRL Y-12698]
MNTIPTYDFEQMIHYSLLNQQPQMQLAQQPFEEARTVVVDGYGLPTPTHGSFSMPYQELTPYQQYQPMMQKNASYEFYPSVYMEPVQMSSYTYATPEVFDFLPPVEACTPSMSYATQPQGYFTPSPSPVTFNDLPQECFSLNSSPLERNHFFMALDNATVSPSQESTKSKHAGSRCHMCNKYIRRDMTRHLRTHESVSRFQCIFPKEECSHKTHQFNRPYDFKKHLLNSHFQFTKASVKKLHNLNEKLPFEGTCPCNKNRVFTANEWLHNHVLSADPAQRCPIASDF